MLKADKYYYKARIMELQVSSSLDKQSSLTCDIIAQSAEGNVKNPRKKVVLPEQFHPVGV